MGSEDVPDYAILVSTFYGINHGKEAILPGAAKPILYEDLGFESRVVAKMEYLEGRYVVEIMRPLALDARKMLELKVVVSVGIGFAVGQFGRGIEHRATDMVSYVFELVEEEFAGKPGAGEAFNLYGAVSEYGHLSWYVAAAAVLAHLVRRKAWSVKEHSEMVVLERHILAARVAHWLRVAFLTMMTITGLSILFKAPLFGAMVRDIHVWFAFAILFTDLPLHIYSLVKTHEWKHLLVLNRDDVYVAITIVKNFLGLTKDYPPHAVYDDSTKTYYMGRKYCSLQKPLLWFYFIAGVVFGLTGFAMAYPSALPWVFTALSGGINVRALHPLIFYLSQASSSPTSISPSYLKTGTGLRP
ncbi:MAG: hypothetical protein QXQ48_07875 [Nitrososphaerota archaeon]